MIDNPAIKEYTKLSSRYIKPWWICGWHWYQSFIQPCKQSCYWHSKLHHRWLEWERNYGSPIGSQWCLSWYRLWQWELECPIDILCCASVFVKQSPVRKNPILKPEERQLVNCQTSILGWIMTCNYQSSCHLFFHINHQHIPNEFISLTLRICYWRNNIDGSTKLRSS